MRAINAAIDKGNEQLLLEALKEKPAGLSSVVDDKINWYMQHLSSEKAAKADVRIDYFLLLPLLIIF